MESSDESRAVHVVLFALAIPVVGVVVICVALYIGALVLFTYAADNGEISRSGTVVGHTTDGHSYVLPHGTPLHYEGNVMRDGQKALKITIKSGPLKGMVVFVPDGSIIVYGKSVYP